MTEVKKYIKNKLNESATKKEVVDFLLDFNFLLSLNLAKVQGQAIDDKAKQSLAQMQQKFKTPVVNGKTFFELADERITPRKDLFNPKFLSAVLTQIRNYLIYIKEHINRFVVDGQYKDGWLNRITKLESEYKRIIGGSSVNEKIINEVAKQMSDLPEDAALFVTDHGTWLNFILYSKSENKVYGTIITADIKDSGEIQEVKRIAAEKGYGPLMYEMAMGYMRPSYLMPSRDGDIRGEAWDVWLKFYDRKDVIKKTLPIEDDLFSFVLVTGDNDEYFESVEEKREMFDDLDKKFKKDILVFNTMYQYRNPMILKLIYRADEQIKNKEVDYADVSKAATEFFTQKYL